MAIDQNNPLAGTKPSGSANSLLKPIWPGGMMPTNNTGNTGSGINTFYNYDTSNLLPYSSKNTNYESTYNYQTPTSQSLGIGQWEAPKVQLPDYSKLSPLQDYTGRIQQAADMSVKTGLEQLQNLVFRPEYDVERERQESRGLVGSGVENENLQNLLTSQQSRANEFSSNIYNQAFKEQTSELQSLRELGVRREELRLNQEFEASIQNGDWEQAARIHDDNVKLELEDLILRNEQWKETHKLDIVKFNDDAAYREWDSTYKNEMMKFDIWEAETGFSFEEEKLDLAEQDAAYQEGAAAEYKGGDLIRFVNDVLANPDQPRRTVEQIKQSELDQIGKPLNNTTYAKENLLSPRRGGVLVNDSNGTPSIRIGEEVWYEQPNGFWARYR